MTELCFDIEVFRWTSVYEFWYLVAAEQSKQKAKKNVSGYSVHCNGMFLGIDRF